LIYRNLIVFTYLESTIALSVIIKENKTQFGDFCNELKFIRYGMGNERVCITTALFLRLDQQQPAKRYPREHNREYRWKAICQEYSFHDKNRTKYPHLKEDSSLVIVKKVEEELSSMNKFYIRKRRYHWLRKDQGW